jgi:hypothetical protein
MKVDDPHANVVSQLRQNRRPTGRARMMQRASLIVAALVAAGAVMSPTRLVRGSCLLAMLTLAVGSTIAWLAGTGPQLSESGREMRDD